MIRKLILARIRGSRSTLYLYFSIGFIIIWFLVLGVIGLDWTGHWDEPFHYIALKRTFSTGRFLPGWYGYPSILYIITLVSTIPLVLFDYSTVFSNLPYSVGLAGFGGGLNYMTQDRAFLNLPNGFGGPDHLIYIRWSCLVVSSLAIIWMMLSSHFLWRDWRLTTLTGLLASSSWEFAYHSRWVAPDSIACQFAALTLLFLILSWHKSERFIYLSAISSGLALGTKYTLGPLLFPVCLTALLLNGSQSSLTIRLRRAFYSVCIYFVTFLICTPGAVFEPFKFYADVQSILVHNITFMAQSSYYSDSYLSHLSYLFTYLSESLMSGWRGIAYLWFSMAVIGCVSIVFANRIFWIVLISFPIVYLFSISSASSFIVRNYLPMFPFLLLFCVKGIGQLGRFGTMAPKVRATYYSIIFSLALLSNIYCLISSLSISKGVDFGEMAALEYARTNPDKLFAISPHIYSYASAHNINLSQNIAIQGGAQVDYLLGLYTEIDGYPGKDWFLNSYAVVPEWFGSREVNLRKYPDWPNKKVILVNSMEAQAKNWRFK